MGRRARADSNGPYREGRGRSGARHPVWRAHRREQVRRKRMPMRWCRSQKPAKSTASAFPVLAGCHPAVLTLTPPPENGSDPESIAESALHSIEKFHRCVAVLLSRRRERPPSFRRLAISPRCCADQGQLSPSTSARGFFRDSATFSVNPDNYQRQTHTPRTQPQ
jgi:hypothetical protein